MKITWRKAAALLLQLVLIWNCVPGAGAFSEGERYVCGTEEEMQEELFAELIEKKLLEFYGGEEIIPYMYPYMEWRVIPSVGNVRVLVLPIRFSDSQTRPENGGDWEAEYACYKEKVFGEDAGGPMNEQSLRALLLR